MGADVRVLHGEGLRVVGDAAVALATQIERKANELEDQGVDVAAIIDGPSCVYSAAGFDVLGDLRDDFIVEPYQSPPDDNHPMVPLMGLLAQFAEPSPAAWVFVNLSTQDLWLERFTRDRHQLLRAAVVATDVVDRIIKAQGLVDGLRDALATRPHEAPSPGASLARLSALLHQAQADVIHPTARHGD